MVFSKSLPKHQMERKAKTEKNEFPGTDKSGIEVNNVLL